MKNFLKKISNWKAQEIEFNIGRKAIPFSKVKEYDWKENIYFLANVKNINKRNWDWDIIEKKYFCFDIDIRQNFIKKMITWKKINYEKLSPKNKHKYNLEFWKKISNENIKKYKDIIKWKIKSHKFLSQYDILCYSWNWLHIYYFIDGEKPDAELYKFTLMVLQDERDKIMNDEMLKCDRAVCNIWRILRLPWTINVWMKTKFWMKPVRCEILEERNVKVLWDVYELWRERLRQEKILREKKMQEFLRKEKERKINFSWNIQTYEAICRIPLNEIITQEYWVIQKWNYFEDPKEKDYIWILYIPDNNLIWHWWSSRVSWDKGTTYNTFTYIQTKYWLSDSQTFEWFNKNYNNIKEIDKQNQKNYMKEKELKEWLKEIKRDDIELDEIDMDLTKIIPYTRWTKNLDLKFWKFERWRYWVVLWESWSWKTNFCFFTAKENAKNNIKVCFITMEMTIKNLFYRLAKKKAWITIQEWNTKKISDYKKKIFKESVIELNGLKDKWLWFFYIPQWTIDIIKEFIIKKKQEWFELFYIDNLDYIIAEEWISDYERVNKVSRILKHLSTEEDITIFLIHHFKKWSDKDRNKPRWFWSVRWSWKIENDVDYWIRVWRDQNTDDDIQRRDVIISLLKDRENWIITSETIYYNKWEYQDEFPESNIDILNWPSDNYEDIFWEEEKF